MKVASSLALLSALLFVAAQGVSGKSAPLIGLSGWQDALKEQIGQESLKAEMRDVDRQADDGSLISDTRTGAPPIVAVTGDLSGTSDSAVTGATSDALGTGPTSDALGTGPTSDDPGTGPSSDAPGTGPSSEAPGTGPSTVAPGTGPSSDAPGTGPSSEAPGTGPSSDAPVTGPSSDAPGTGPSSEAPVTGPSSEAPVTGPSSDAPVPGSSTDSPPSGDDGLTGGEIAGIVIGTLAGVALIGGGIYYVYMKKMWCFENM